MKQKDVTRLMAGGSLAGIFAVHWLPKRLLPFASPTLASLLIIGGLLYVHRNPFKGLWRDIKVAVAEQANGGRTTIKGTAQEGVQDAPVKAIERQPEGEPHPA